MKHKKKVKMARKMLSKKEIKNHTPIFQSDAWEQRKDSKLERVIRQREQALKRREEKKKLKNNN